MYLFLDSSRSFLCEVTGNFIAEVNTSNSTDLNLVSVSENYGSNSEKSFVFNLDGCVSAPANNGMVLYVYRFI